VNSDPTQSPVSYKDTLWSFFATPHIRPVISIELVFLGVFSIVVDATYRRRSRRFYHPTIRDLINDAKLLGDQISEGENADERIANLLLSMDKLENVTFVGGRFWSLFSSSAQFPQTLKDKFPNLRIEVLFQDPYERSMMIRMAVLGYRFEKGCLQPLVNCIENVRNTFGDHAAKLVSQQPACRVVIAEKEKNSITVILQPLRRFHEARISGGYMFSTNSAPALVNLVITRVALRRQHAIALNEAWITQQDNQHFVKAFALDTRLVRPESNATETQLAVCAGRYRRFIKLQTNSSIIGSQP